ncbi:MAG TPA: hypothetical protein VMN83_16835 [Albitalea sp.]|nr:hypothetical protein [Albitalea sp.]
MSTSNRLIVHRPSPAGSSGGKGTRKKLSWSIVKKASRPASGVRTTSSREEYPVLSPMEKRMAIQAQRNRARLHVLRDNVHRAKRDVKRNLAGAAERLKMHLAARLAYAETRK